MQIIFVNRYFYPDHSATSQMLSDLTFALAKSGHKIAVVTSRQLYECPESELPSQETVASVVVHRVWTSRFGRHNLIGRAIDYLTFYLSAAWRLWRVLRQGDVIVVKTDPPMLSVVTAPIARIRGAKLVNWLQDLFPEVLEALDVDRTSARRTVYNFIRILRNYSLQTAHMNIVIGEHMAERLARFDVLPERIRIIPNWADGAVVTPRPPKANCLRQEWSLEDKFVVGYSGNFGRAHEITTLIEAIADLEQDANRTSAVRENSDRKCDVAWLFIGGGALYRQLQTEVAVRGFTSVHFRPYQPRERLAESLSLPDIHLVSLRPELEGLIVPSKYYGIAAAGRPAIFVGDVDGEIARILDADGIGRSVALGDGAGLAALIQAFAANPDLARDMGRRARKAFEHRFNFPVAISGWEKALRAVQNDLTETARDDVDRTVGLPQNRESRSEGALQPITQTIIRRG
jgi:glycosyltransferase involved in cell wall biosynthesis